MIQRIFPILILTLFSLTGHAQELTAMTYNIRLDIASDKENSWEHRKDFLSSQILFIAPDVLGVQEALPNQLDDLKKALGAYAFIGLGRDGGATGEHSGIFYNTTTIQLHQEHTFWLSGTPQQVSIGWDAAFKRVCTYGLFEVKATGQRFWMFNTHLDHVGDMARVEGMQLILDTIDRINTQEFPIILTGDFNVEPNSEVINNIKHHLSDSRDRAAIVYGPVGTFNAFKYETPVTRRIDYIMVSEQIEVLKYGVLSGAIDFKFPSDHFPVVVQMKLK